MVKPSTAGVGQTEKLVSWMQRLIDHGYNIATRKIQKRLNVSDTFHWKNLEIPRCTIPFFGGSYGWRVRLDRMFEKIIGFNNIETFNMRISADTVYTMI